VSAGMSSILRSFGESRLSFIHLRRPLAAANR
jgi:hypothetical protein